MRVLGHYCAIQGPKSRNAQAGRRGTEVDVSVIELRIRRDRLAAVGTC